MGHKKPAEMQKNIKIPERKSIKKRENTVCKTNMFHKNFISNV